MPSCQKLTSTGTTSSVMDRSPEPVLIGRSRARIFFCSSSAQQLKTARETSACDIHNVPLLFLLTTWLRSKKTVSSCLFSHLALQPQWAVELCPLLLSLLRQLWKHGQAVMEGVGWPPLPGGSPERNKQAIHKYLHQPHLHSRNNYFTQNLAEASALVA